MNTETDTNTEGTYGYKYVRTEKGGRYEIDEYPAGAVRTIFEGFGAGQTLDDIAAKLNESGEREARKEESK